MAVQDFVVKLSLDTSGFGRSMTSINRDMKLLKSEFSASDEKLKNFGSTTDQLKNKQDYLSKSLVLQKEKVDSLKEAYDKQVKATGENSKEAQNLGVRLNNQVKYYNKLEKELEETNSELEQQTNKFNKLSKSMSNAQKKIQGFSQKLGNMGKFMSTHVTAPITGAFTALTKGTEETREQLAFLETNTKLAGLSFEDMKKHLVDVTSITGEADAAVEGLSDIMASGLNFSNTEKAIQFATDAAVKFKDTLKFEGVAEGIQESLATGELTGPFCEALERSAVDVDALKDKLKSTNDVNERFKILMEASGVIVSGASDEFKKLNPDLVKHNESMEKLRIKAADIGERIIPLIQPFLDDMIGFLDRVDKFANDHPDMFDKIVKALGAIAVIGPAILFVNTLVSGVGKLFGGISKIAGAFGAEGMIGKLFASGGMLATGGTIATAFSSIGKTIATGLSSPLGATIAIITAVVAGFTLLYNHCDLFKATVDEIWGWLYDHISNFPKWFDGVLTEVDNWTQEHLNNFPKWCSAKWDETTSSFSEMCDNWNNFWGGLWEDCKSTFGGAWNWVKEHISNFPSYVWDHVKGIPDMLKGLFDFEWHLPHIPLPHFRKVGETALGLPNIDVEWYKNGGIMTKPTMFGLNGNNPMVGGEAGAEAILPLRVLFKQMRDIMSDELDRDKPIENNVFVKVEMDGQQVGNIVTYRVEKNINRRTRNYGINKRI